MENNNSAFHQEEVPIIDLSDIWGIFWNHKWWYVLSMAICMSAAAFYLFITPVVYKRSVKVIIDESSQDATLRNLGVISSNMVRTRTYNTVENEMQALVSPDLMQTVVERLGLQTRYTEKQTLRKVELYPAPIELRIVEGGPQSEFSFEVKSLGDNEVLLSDFKLSGNELDIQIRANLCDTLLSPVGKIILFPTDDIADFSRPIVVTWTNTRSTAKAYVDRLKVSLATKESSVIVLSMDDTYPARAESVLSSLINVYNEVWINNKNRAAINTTEFINERLVVIEKDLSAVEEALKDYKSKNNLTDIKAVGQAYLQESSHYASKSFELNNQLSIAKYIREYLTDPVNRHTLIPSNLGLQSGAVESQIGEYNSLILQRDRLIVGSSESNPLISDINASLNSIRGAILRSIDNLIATLELQIKKIDSQERQILSRIASSSGQELKLLSIERQQQITQNLYVFLLQKREENELAALVNVGNTRVIMSPDGSSYPVSPNKKLIMLVALVLGFGIPFGVFFLIKIFDHTIKVKSDLGNLSVPFLAEIPIAPSGKTGMVVSAGNRDVMNEAFRVLRTNVDMMIGRKQQSKVIMFTSFSPGSGKTYTTMNLASSMSLKGSKVLMIDLDLRKATLSKDLNVEHSGIAAYLNGKLDDYHDGIEKINDTLDFIPVGTLPPNPTELLLTERFATLIEKLRGEYDDVFLDCPPIDIVADANIITQYVDLTVFVLRSGKLSKQIVSDIEELYKSGKFNHMAVMLNFVDMQYKKYNYGKSSYGYGYGNL